MKKALILLTVCCFLICSIIFSACINVFAATENSSAKPEISQIINARLSDSEIKTIKGLDAQYLFDESGSLKYPVLKMYPEIFTSYVGSPLETVIEQSEAFAKKAKSNDYVVIADTPYWIRFFNSESETSATIANSYYNEVVPKYISDIANMSTSIVVNGETCKLKGICCFDALTSHMGAAIYLQTDKGIYVRYYENQTSSAVLFTEDDFRSKAYEYYKYLISYENNYDQSGEATVGGKISFLAFEPNNETVDIGSTSPITDAPADINQNSQNNNYYIIIAVVGAVVIVLPLPFIIILCKKRKRS